MQTLCPPGKGGGKVPPHSAAQLSTVIQMSRRVFCVRRPSSIRIFVRTLYPHERLEIDHVAGVEVPQVAAYGSSEGKQALVGREIRTRLILEGKAVGVG